MNTPIRDIMDHDLTLCQNLTVTIVISRFLVSHWS
jgi:hypothetical protein